MKSISTPPRLVEQANLDDWVRHVIDIHFHPTLGTPYWIERARELGFDPRKEIRSYSDLALLGFFPIEVLRKRDVRDFLPAAIARDVGHLRVHETGGTTGLPARIAFRDFFAPITRWMDWYLDEVIGFPRGVNWLFIGPTGPHGVGDTTLEIAQRRGGMCSTSSIWIHDSSSSCTRKETPGLSLFTWSTSGARHFRSWTLRKFTCWGRLLSSSRLSRRS